MADNPYRPLLQATRVIKWSRELSPIKKLVWLETYVMVNKAEGCYLPAPKFGDRIGLTKDQVEPIWRELIMLELLRSDGTQGRAGSHRWVQVPPGCTPKSGTPTPEAIAACGAILDAHIVRMRASNGAAATPLPPDTGEAERRKAVTPFRVADEDDLDRWAASEKREKRERGPRRIGEITGLLMAQIGGLPEPVNGAIPASNGAESPATIKGVLGLKQEGERKEIAFAPSSVLGAASAFVYSPPSSPEDGAESVSVAHGKPKANDNGAAQKERDAAPRATPAQLDADEQRTNVTERIADYRARLEVETDATQRKVLEHSIRTNEQHLARLAPLSSAAAPGHPLQPKLEQLRAQRAAARNQTEIRLLDDSIRQLEAKVGSADLAA